MTTNKNGIPVVVSRYKPSPGCINNNNGGRKHLFHSAFQAERFIAETIAPKDRHRYRVYPCGDHFHLSTRRP